MCSLRASSNGIFSISQETSHQWLKFTESNVLSIIWKWRFYNFLFSFVLSWFQTSVTAVISTYRAEMALGLCWVAMPLASGMPVCAGGTGQLRSAARKPESRDQDTRARPFPEWKTQGAKFSSSTSRQSSLSTCPLQNTLPPPKQFIRALESCIMKMWKLGTRR